MKKLGLLCLVLFLVLGALGVSYAYWTETLTINGTVNTGELDWEFIAGTAIQRDNGNDVTTNEYLLTFTQHDYDVGHSDNPILISSDMDTDFDTMNINILNAYPGYANRYDVDAYNNGTIPLIIKGAKVIYDGKEYPLGNNVVVTTDDGAFKFRCGFYPGTIMNPGDEPVTIRFTLLVLDGIEYEQNYSFTVKIDAVQFSQP
jgi:predicted ribosomally synthesized peptide with SipW-like signal peptide